MGRDPASLTTLRINSSPLTHPQTSLSTPQLKEVRIKSWSLSSPKTAYRMLQLQIPLKPRSLTIYLTKLLLWLASWPIFSVVLPSASTRCSAIRRSVFVCLRTLMLLYQAFKLSNKTLSTALVVASRFLTTIFCFTRSTNNARWNYLPHRLFTIIPGCDGCQCLWRSSVLHWVPDAEQSHQAWPGLIPYNEDSSPMSSKIFLSSPPSNSSWDTVRWRWADPGKIISSCSLISEPFDSRSCPSLRQRPFHLPESDGPYPEGLARYARISELCCCILQVYGQTSRALFHLLW